tara:strand:- start:783 stop:1112 length:330 start_codon:yes stop_codon:yes gene_type:complete
MKIKSYGSTQTNINGKLVENKKYALRSDGKKAHIIGEDNGKGYFIKIDNVDELFDVAHKNNNNIPLIKKLNKDLKMTKKKKKKRKKTTGKKSKRRTKRKKKKKKIFKFY